MWIHNYGYGFWFQGSTPRGTRALLSTCTYRSWPWSASSWRTTTAPRTTNLSASTHSPSPACRWVSRGTRTHPSIHAHKHKPYLQPADGWAHTHTHIRTQFDATGTSFACCWVADLNLAISWALSLSLSRRIQTRASTRPERRPSPVVGSLCTRHGGRRVVRRASHRHTHTHHTERGIHLKKLLCDNMTLQLFRQFLLVST